MDYSEAVLSVLNLIAGMLAGSCIVMAWRIYVKRQHW